LNLEGLSLEGQILQVLRDLFVNQNESGGGALEFLYVVWIPGHWELGDVGCLKCWILFITLEKSSIHMLEPTNIDIA